MRDTLWQAASASRSELDAQRRRPWSPDEISRSAQAYDRRVKLGDYRGIPSVQEIVLIAQDQLYCEVHLRLEDGRWQTDLLRTPEAELRLLSIGFVQPLSVLYRKVAVGGL